MLAKIKVKRIYRKGNLCGSTCFYLSNFLWNECWGSKIECEYRSRSLWFYKVCIAFQSQVLSVCTKNREKSVLWAYKVKWWKTSALLNNKNANPVSCIAHRCFIQGFTSSSRWVGRWYLGQLLCQLDPHLPTPHLSWFVNI